MHKQTLSSPSSATKKRRILIVLGVVVLGAASGTWYLLSRNDLYDAKTVTTSRAKTAQPTYTEGTDKTPSKNNTNQGGAVDTSGQTSVVTPQSQWKTSSSGIITLYRPTTDETIKTGSVISGAAQVDQVYFRLIDDAVGVTAQGPLQVKDGKFSGSLQFSPKGKTGTLKVFSVDPETEAESNRIEIDVNF